MHFSVQSYKYFLIYVYLFSEKIIFESFFCFLHAVVTTSTVDILKISALKEGHAIITIACPKRYFQRDIYFFFVVTTITPFFPLSPYFCTALGSFSTSIFSIF